MSASTDQQESTPRREQRTGPDGSPSLSSRSEPSVGFADSVNRADFDTGSAIGALVGIDLVFRIALGDAFDGAFFFASTTHGAIIGDNVRHCSVLSLVKLDSGLGTGVPLPQPDFDPGLWLYVSGYANKKNVEKT
jgi:hypothetical protein